MFNKLSSQDVSTQSSSRSITKRKSKHEKIYLTFRQKLKVFIRLITNLWSFGIILSSFILSQIMRSNGMFESDSISIRHQNLIDGWSILNQNCLLNKNGFLNNSCSNKEIQLTGLNAWLSIGKILATDYQNQFKNDNNKFLKSTTCLVGGKSFGWVTVILLVSSGTSYPNCLPLNFDNINMNNINNYYNYYTNRQPIDGFAVIETATGKENMEGFFLLTSFADSSAPLIKIMINRQHNNEILAIDTIHKWLITKKEGRSIFVDKSTQNWAVSTKPIGERYAIHEYCITEIVIDKDSLSYGRQSRLGVTLGHRCLHSVSNAQEMILVQLILSIFSIFLISGDIWTTFQGISGFLRKKPVLTYNLISGLERRKLFLFILLFNLSYCLLYADIARFMYLNAKILWSLTQIMFGTFFSFIIIMFISIIQYIPLPKRYKGFIIYFSSPIFIYSTIIIYFILQYKLDLGNKAHNSFYSEKKDMIIGIFIDNEELPAGSYNLTGIEPIVFYLLPYMIISIIISFLLSFLIPCIYSKRSILNIKWAENNKFIQSAGYPNYITSLPLDISCTVKLGNRVYCKPSTIAIMGYFVLEKVNNIYHIKDTNNINDHNNTIKDNHKKDTFKKENSKKKVAKLKKSSSKIAITTNNSEPNINTTTNISVSVNKKESGSIINDNKLNNNNNTIENHDNHDTNDNNDIHLNKNHSTVSNKDTNKNTVLNQIFHIVSIYYLIPALLNLKYSKVKCLGIIQGAEFEKMNDKNRLKKGEKLIYNRGTFSS